MAAQSTDMTGLGYLGVDLVIDKNNGPLLLELNVRPGLQIQVANRKGLLRRLEMIDRAPTEIFASPEKRVTWSIQNFAEPGVGAPRPKKIDMGIVETEKSPSLGSTVVILKTRRESKIAISGEEPDETRSGDYGEGIQLSR